MYIAPYYIVVCALYFLPYFSTLYHKQYDFRDESYWTKLFFPLQISSEMFLILRSTEIDIIIHVHTYSHKVPGCIYFSDINETWIFTTDFFFKKIKYEIPRITVKSEPSCSIRTDRHDATNCRFSEFFELAYKAVCLCLKTDINLCVGIRIKRQKFYDIYGITIVQIQLVTAAHDKYTLWRVQVCGS